MCVGGFFLGVRLFRLAHCDLLALLQRGVSYTVLAAMGERRYRGETASRLMAVLAAPPAAISSRCALSIRVDQHFNDFSGLLSNLVGFKGEAEMTKTPLYNPRQLRAKLLAYALMNAFGLGRTRMRQPLGTFEESGFT